MFYRLLEKFFEIIVKLPVNAFTGKNMKYEGLIEQESSKEYGAYGHVTAHYGVFEEQTGGHLHYHGLLFGAWNVRVFQLWCHSPECAKIFQQLIDSHISCQIPSELKNPNNRPKVNANINQPYPDAADVEFEGKKLASVLNHHRHSATCWKNFVRKCRLALPQPQAQKTFITEICADVKGNPVRKHTQSKSGEEIISPPPKRGDNVFSVKDLRVIAHRLCRVDAFETMMVDFELLTTALIRCNTSVQVLFTQSQAKAAAFYIASYMSKHPFQLQTIIPLILQAQEQFKKYGSTADDAGTALRKAKNILQKIINKHGILEVSDQQATAAVLGFSSYISSHNFSFVEPWKAVIKHCELYPEVVNDDEDIDDQGIDEAVDDDAHEDINNTLIQLEMDPDTHKAFCISALDRYINRGNELQKYSMYIYSLAIGHRRRPKKRKSGTNPKGAGRPENPIFDYDCDSFPAKRHHQIMRSCPSIPRISGKHPPAYPGDKPKPDASYSKTRSWRKKAKQFVEFYSLLFLPFDKNFKLIAPYHEILPWNEDTSWDKFWTVFNNFEISEKFYHRAVWFIFHNMVDNMRQRKEERKLITAWRFMAAHNRTDEITGQYCTKDAQRRCIDEQDHWDDVIKEAEEIRDKYGPDEPISASNRQKQKAKQYLDNQIETFCEIEQSAVTQSALVSAPVYYKNYTYDECKMIQKTGGIIDTNDDIDSEMKDHEYDVHSTDTDCNFTLEGEKKLVELKDFQKEVVKKLKDIKAKSVATADTRDQQLLAFIQGVPGSGKTTTAGELTRVLGLPTLFSGTTGTAAAELKAETINKILKLGFNTKDFKATSLSHNIRQHIISKFKNKEVLVIDEVSMLTPVTLNKISWSLQQTFGNEYLFGGFDVILIGDMMQFEPVQPGLRKPALYQAAVMLGLSMKLPNEAYRVGAELFTRFQMVVLDGQVRATEEYNSWLGDIRNTRKKYPITEDWLSKLNILTTADFEGSNKDNIDWTSTTIVVSGNPERYRFLERKMLSYGKKYQQPILKWECPVKRKDGHYGLLSIDPKDSYDELIKYFARGASCVLTKSVDTTLGLGKGSPGIFLDVAWNPQDKIDIDKLEPGVITVVPQPIFIVVKIGKQIVVLSRKTVRLTDKKKSRTYKAHECELAAARTFHKMQGKTCESVILSLNSRKGISTKIYPITLNSLYVGCSRVGDHHRLRVLPLSKADKDYLKKLQWDKYLRIFFSNYDKDGKWIPDGLKQYRCSYLQDVQLNLAMSELKHLTVEELKKFAMDLDINVIGNKKEHYITALTEAHDTGKKLLNENDQYHLKQKKIKLLTTLKQKNIDKMRLKDLKYYGKRLQLTNYSEIYNDQAQLIQGLKQILQQQCDSEVDDIQMILSSDDEDVLPEMQNEQTTDIVNVDMISNTMNQMQIDNQMDVDDDDEQIINVNENGDWQCSTCCFMNPRTTSDCLICKISDLSEDEEQPIVDIIKQEAIDDLTQDVEMMDLTKENDMFVVDEKEHDQSNLLLDNPTYIPDEYNLLEQQKPNKAMIAQYAKKSHVVDWGEDDDSWGHPNNDTWDGNEDDESWDEDEDDDIKRKD